jgi:hypothetical protein
MTSKSYRKAGNYHSWVSSALALFRQVAPQCVAVERCGHSDVAGRVLSGGHGNLYRRASIGPFLNFTAAFNDP